MRRLLRVFKPPGNFATRLCDGELAVMFDEIDTAIVKPAFVPTYAIAGIALAAPGTHVVVALAGRGVAVGFQMDLNNQAALDVGDLEGSSNDPLKFILGYGSGIRSVAAAACQQCSTYKRTVGVHGSPFPCVMKLRNYPVGTQRSI